MSRNLVKAAGLLLVINVCVKLLGFGRELAIANKFGASSLSDAYLVAYTLPYFLQAILGYAFVSAVLPMFTRYWREQDDNREAFRLGSTLITLTALLTLVLCLAGIAAAPQLVWLTAPALDADTAALAARLTRIMFPSISFMSVGMVISGMLNSRYRFVAAALAPGVAALAIIIAALCFSRGNIEVVAWGTLIGFIAFFLLQALDLRKIGFRFLPVCDLRHPAVRQVGKIILPIVLGLAVNQIYTICNRIFASGLAEGSITVLNYANKLMNLPLGLFVAAIITAVFPALAEQARQTDKTVLAATVSRGLALILLIALPSMLGLMLLDQQIVSLLFESGQFTAAASHDTAQALLMTAPGLPFLGISMLLMRVYYALDDVKTPLLTGSVSIAVNVAASLLLVGPLTHAGLALANSLAALVNALLLLLLLRRRLPYTAYLRRTLIVSLPACALLTLTVGLGARWLPAAAGRLELGIEVLALIALGAGAYFLTLWLLKAEALRDVLQGLKRKRPV